MVQINTPDVGRLFGAKAPLQSHSDASTQGKSVTKPGPEPLPESPACESKQAKPKRSIYMYIYCKNFQEDQEGTE